MQQLCVRLISGLLNVQGVFSAIRIDLGQCYVVMPLCLISEPAKFDKERETWVGMTTSTIAN